jgi:hypothetical protein
MTRPEEEASTPSPAPTRIEINDDLTMVRALLAAQIEALNGSKLKSRARALVITKLEEASMWANEGLRLE